MNSVFHILVARVDGSRICCSGGEMRKVIISRFICWNETQPSAGPLNVLNTAGEPRYLKEKKDKLAKLFSSLSSWPYISFLLPLASVADLNDPAQGHLFGHLNGRASTAVLQKKAQSFSVFNKFHRVPISVPLADPFGKKRLRDFIAWVKFHEKVS